MLRTHPCSSATDRMRQVRVETSERRRLLMSIMEGYEQQHPEFEMMVGVPRLEGDQYREVLLDSKFTISPRGLHPETFRLYESLESG